MLSNKLMTIWSFLNSNHLMQPKHATVIAGCSVIHSAQLQNHL